MTGGYVNNIVAVVVLINYGKVIATTSAERVTAGASGHTTEIAIASLRNLTANLVETGKSASGDGLRDYRSLSAVKVVGEQYLSHCLSLCLLGA